MIIKTLSHKLKKAYAIGRQFGPLIALRHTINSLLSPWLHFEAKVIIKLPLSTVAAHDSIPEDVDCRFLTFREIESYSAIPEYQISAELIELAKAGSDSCYGCFVQGELASYGWYHTASAVTADDFGLKMKIPAEAAYMHHGWTLPPFRGRRLHGLGMQQALLELSQQGISHLISDVDWANGPSLKSCQRLGYQILGNLKTFHWGNHHFCWPCYRLGRQNIVFYRTPLRQVSAELSPSGIN